MVSDTLNLYCKVTKYFSNTQIIKQLFLKKKFKTFSNKRNRQFEGEELTVPPLRLASSSPSIGGLLGLCLNHRAVSAYNSVRC